MHAVVTRSEVTGSLSHRATVARRPTDAPAATHKQPVHFFTCAADGYWAGHSLNNPGGPGDGGAQPFGSSPSNPSKRAGQTRAAPAQGFELVYRPPLMDRPPVMKDRVSKNSLDMEKTPLLLASKLVSKSRPPAFISHAFVLTMGMLKRSRGACVLLITQQEIESQQGGPSSSSGALTADPSPSNQNWVYLVALCALSVVVCYADRSNISTAVLPMAEQFNWDKVRRQALAITLIKCVSHTQRSCMQLATPACVPHQLASQPRNPCSYSHTAH